MREKSRDMNDRIQGILAGIRTKQLRRLIIYALFLILSQVSFNKSINHLIIRCKQSLRVFILQNAAVSYISRALTPLFGNGAGAFRIGKNSVILTKIGKNQNVLCMKLLMLN